MAVALLGACVTPSVPIPPPEPEKMVFDVEPDDGTAQFVYDPDPSYAFAIVYIFNRDIGDGIITTARDDGSVGPTAPFAAEENDELVISFEKGEQLSSRCIVVREGRSSSAFECDL